MGNQGSNHQKKIPVINKTQLEVACTKARIHLELMRDRKNAQIIKSEREFVLKLKSPCRNKVQQILIAERVTNGLKYAQACNILSSYAASLKSQANYIAENVANSQKIQPWLMQIFSLQYAADHMGLSSLNQYKQVIRSLYDPNGIVNYCNKDIIQLLSPTPTPEEVNIYVVQMSERNQILLEEINIVGHKYTKQWAQVPPVELDQQFLDMKKHLADQMSKNMGGGGNQPGSQPGFGGNQPGSQGGFGGNQGGFGGNQGGFGGNQGGYGYGGNNNGQNNIPQQAQQKNPYQGLSHMNNGPQYYQPSSVKPQQPQQKPKEFTSFDEMMGMSQKQGTDHKLPLYPQVDLKQYKQQDQYKPVHNPFTPPEEQKNHNSPTLSQIMKDFDKKQ